MEIKLYLKKNYGKIIFSFLFLFMFSSLVIIYFPLISLIGITFQKECSKDCLSIDNGNVYSKKIDLVKNNKKVSLIGMQHMARPSFYEKISNYTNIKDSIILIEGFDKESILNFKDNDISCYRNSLEKDNKIFYVKFLLSVFDFDYQDERYIRESNKIARIDLEGKDLSRNDRILFAQSQGCKPRASLLFPLNANTEEIDKINNENNRIDKEIEKVLSKYHDGISNEWIIDKRNEKIVNFIINNNNEKHFIVPWGAMHIGGIKKNLIENGFSIIHQERIKIYNISRLFFHYTRNFIKSFNKLSISIRKSENLGELKRVSSNNIKG